MFNQPANVFTADFISNPRINLIEGVLEKRDDKLVVVARQMEIPLTSSKDLSGFLGKTLKVGLRAEDFVLSNTAAEGLLIAEVESVLPAGSEWFVRVRIGQEVVMTSTTNDPQVTIGDPIWIKIKNEKIKCFDGQDNLIIGVGATYGGKWHKWD